MERRAAWWTFPVALVPAALAAPVLFGRILLYRDILHFFVPQQVHAAQARAAWHLPLWDPSRYGGAPFLAEIQNGFFYPPNFVFHLFNPFIAATVFVLLHLPLAGAGAYLLARSLGTQPRAAALAGTGFAASGYLLSMQGGHVYFASAAWLPMAVFALARAAQHRTARAVVLAALPPALMILAGELQALVFAGAVAAVLALCGPDRVARLAAVAASSVLGGALGAVQLLPALAFTRATVRAHGLPLAEASVWSLHPLRTIELLVPLPFGVAWPDNGYWGSLLLDGPHALPWAASLFIGPALLLPALAPPLRDTRRRALAAMAVVALLLAFGSHLPLFRPVFEWVPLLNRFRYPEKYALVATLALCLLGAARAEELPARTAWQLFGSAAVALVAAALIAPPLLQDAMARGLRASGANLDVPAARAALLHSLLASAAACAALATAAYLLRDKPAVLLLAWLGIGGISQVAAGMRTLAWGDGAFSRKPPSYAARFAGALPAESTGRILFLPCQYTGGGQGPLIERLKAFEWETGKENFPLLFGFREALGYGAAEDARQIALFRALRPAGLEKAVRAFGGAAIAQCGSLRLLPDPMPRVRLVPGRAARDVPAALLERRGWSEVFLEGGEAPGAGGRAEIAASAPEEVRAHASGGGGALVLAEAQAEGWSATLDGAPVPILLADGQFRSVRVPPGDHEVLFRYTQPGLRTGAWISLAALLLAGASLLRRAGTASKSP
jgi:hypothetical protein